MPSPLVPSTSVEDLGAQADVARWRALPELDDRRRAIWRRRARLAASLVKPDSRVLDLGCGEMLLGDELPEGCRYVPSDCVPRDERTMVFDYNRELPPLGDYDYVTALGVAEYLVDPARFFAELSDYRTTLIFTYHPLELWGGGDPRQLGWPTLLDTVAIGRALRERDYVVIVETEVLTNEHLYVAIPSPIRLPR